MGVCADVAEGRLDGITTDAWTEAQVAPRRTRPTAELLDEWDRVRGQFWQVVPREMLTRLPHPLSDAEVALVAAE